MITSQSVHTVSLDGYVLRWPRRFRVSIITTPWFLETELRNCVKVEVAVHFRNKCDGFCGRKATLNLNSDTQSSGAVWKSRWPSLIVFIVSVSKKTWCLTSTKTVRLMRDREKWKRGRLYTYCYTVTTTENDFCIKMGSDHESHFNVSFIVRDKGTRQCPQTTTFEEKGEPKRIRTEVPLLISLMPCR